MEWSANSSLKKNVKRVSKVLKWSKHHNIWVQIKENLNIQFLLFKYLVFFHIYGRLNFSYQILHSFFLFPFVVNVIFKLSTIFESIKYELAVCKISNGWYISVVTIGILLLVWHSFVSTAKAYEKGSCEKKFEVADIFVRKLTFQHTKS